MHAPLSPRTEELEDAQRLKIVIVGHVDHGKSTLIGRLLFDTHSLADGKIEQVQKACAAEGMDFEYAFLLDALLEEQEQNITIDTTQIQFRTETRNYVIVDAPGHKEFLKNMITGAASADAAIVLLDAREGLQEQTRRHGYLLSLLGVKQVLVAVNKMDLVDFSQTTFNDLERDYRAFLEPYDIHPLHFIPMSAKLGHNIVQPSGAIGEMLSKVLGATLPDILYDGIADPKKQVDGKMPDDLAIRIHDNGKAGFANFDATALRRAAETGKAPNIVRDLKSYEGSMKALAPVSIEGSK